MKKAMVSWTLTLILLGTVAAEYVRAEDTAPNGTRHFCWKVPGERNVVYLLGSVHLAPPGLLPMDPAIEAAFAASSSLVVEADVAGADEGKLEQKILARGMYPAGEQTLAGELPADLYAAVKKEFTALDFPADMLDRMRPWMAALTLSALRLQQLGMGAENGIDLYFLRKAAETSKKVLELESVDFQIDLLSGFPRGLQVKFLRQTLEDRTMMKQEMQAMIGAWKTGDAAAMARLILRQREASPDLEEVYVRILDDRNVTMTAHIREYLQGEGDVFVVVGAGHLVGEKGILQLLESAGYQPEQF
jgi:uncharacterized protein YbaP (TraB family)